MPKAVTRQAHLNSAVNRALRAESDYSTAFTQKVHAMAGRIEHELSFTVQHDSDMNYSAAQKLIVWLDRSYRAVSPNDPKGRYQLISYVSSKGPFVAFVVMKLSDMPAGSMANGPPRPGRGWTILAAKNTPEEIATIQKKIATAMRSCSFTLLEEPVLSQAAEMHLTELDGKPATVFDTLFSELY